MSNNKDFKVKNGIQPTVYQEGVGTVVSGSVGYNLAGASYDSVSFSVASQETTPKGLFFKSDGTKMYILGLTSDLVHQYSLSTSFDLSTALYDSVSFSVAAQEATPMQVHFSGDGTKMFIVGNTNDTVYQYSLSTAFDISTASYDSVSFSVSGQDVAPYGMTFSNDGTKMYIVGVVNLSIFQYSLSTAFDLSTASYDSVSFSVASQDTDPRSITFNNDGTILYLVGETNNTVFQYSLSTGFDLSTASYTSISFSVASQDTNPWSVSFNNDGTKMYVVGDQNNSVYQYSTVLTTAELDLSTGSVFEVTPTSDVQVTLSNPAASGTVSGATLLLGGGVVPSTAWDISTASYLQNFSVASQEDNPQGIFLKPDGTKMYVTGFGNDNVNEYDLSTAWDISTASYLQLFSVSSQQTTPYNVFFKPDGTKMYITGSSGQDVSEYNLSTAWDISTASYLQNFSVASQVTTPTGTFFKPDGTKMYVTGSDGRDVNEYNLSTAWDVSTASYLQNFSVASQETSPQGVFFKPDGIKMYVTGRDGDDVNEYNLSTAWDVSTASYLQNFSVASNETAPRDVFFKPDGTKMYVTGSDGDNVNEYNIGASATITYDPTLEWPGGTAPTSPAIGETDIITFNTRDGGSTYQGVLAIDGAK